MTKAELEAKVLELEKKIAVLEAHRCESHVHYHTHVDPNPQPLRLPSLLPQPYIGDPYTWPTTTSGTTATNVPPCTPYFQNP